MFNDYFSLAFRNLRKKGLRSWLTILGIFIGIAAVVSLISLGAGLRTAITGQFGGLSIDVLTIQNKGTGFGPPGSTVVTKLNDHDLKLIKSIKGIKRVVPRVIRIGNLEYNHISEFSYVSGLPEDKSNLNFIYDRLGIKVIQGRLLHPTDRGKILLGNDFLDKNKFGKILVIGKKIKINGKYFEIAGFLAKSSNMGLNKVVFLMESDIKKILNIGKEYDLFIVQAEDKKQISDVAVRIADKLRKDRHEKFGEETFTVETPLQSLSAVNTILDIINLIVIGIAAISLFVGGIGIANTMYTSVLERTKEIGVMKAIGAKNKDIMIIFLIESGLLGLAGGIGGALIGLAGALEISKIANHLLGNQLFAVNISYPLLLGAVMFSFVVGIISGVLPALQASKLNVVDAFRS